MPEPRLVIEGLDKLMAALDHVVERARKAAEESVAEEVKDVQADARRFSPDDTGELDSKIGTKAKSLEGEVRSRARHSGFVEHGTYKDKAQPYMTPAAEISRRRFPARTGARIKTTLEALGL